MYWIQHHVIKLSSVCGYVHRSDVLNVYDFPIPGWSHNLLYKFFLFYQKWLILLLSYMLLGFVIGMGTHFIIDQSSIGNRFINFICLIFNLTPERNLNARLISISWELDNLHDLVIFSNVATVGIQTETNVFHVCTTQIWGENLLYLLVLYVAVFALV